jgi:NitT/TauT family transport system substrate-binding protein
MRALIALCAMLMVAAPARAEVTEVIIAQQYGVAMLPLMVMERMGFAEKQAKAAGLPPLSVQFRQVAGPSVMNDGLISGALQFGALGAPSLITLWDRTRNNVGVMGVASVTTYPLFLITRNPAVKAVRDFTGADKIAVPSVKISTQAIMLQMLSASLYGDKDYQHLDPLTVSLSHPDAAQALISGTAGVNAHFSSSPFYEQEMKTPGVHVLTTNYEILGGPATALVLAASRRFHDANPKTFRAVYDGLGDAIAWINADKQRAAALYIEMAKDTRNSVDDILKVISDKDYAYTLRPSKVFATAVFMAKVGSIKQAPGSIDDLFFPDVAGQKGD